MPATSKRVCESKERKAQECIFVIFPFRLLHRMGKSKKVRSHGESVGISPARLRATAAAAPALSLTSQPPSKPTLSQASVEVQLSAFPDTVIDHHEATDSVGLGHFRGPSSAQTSRCAFFCSANDLLPGLFFFVATAGASDQHLPRRSRLSQQRRCKRFPPRHCPTFLTKIPAFPLPPPHSACSDNDSAPTQKQGTESTDEIRAGMLSKSNLWEGS